MPLALICSCPARHHDAGGKAMFQMLGVFAQFERSIIQQRVRAGLRRAVAEGKQLEARILAALKAPGRT
jgi:DNA invertase Pin-like site-specific DNA recombinase